MHFENPRKCDRCGMIVYSDQAMARHKCWLDGLDGELDGDVFEISND